MAHPLRILFTGGRAPATLDWARLCAQYGHKVWLAESMPWTITSFSTHIVSCLTVPTPRQRPQAFIDSLIQHVKTHKIDILVPTCEEVFWVARGKEQLEDYCSVFTPPLDQLRQMHSKFTFLDVARSADVRAPNSQRLTRPSDLTQFINNTDKLVFKPEFSRFGTSVLVRPSTTALAQIRPTETHPWLAQECIVGQQYASWSLCRSGIVLAHVAYPITHRAGIGSAVHFRSVAQPEISDAVKRIAAKMQWTGQLAFDFIAPVNEAPYVIECNPRLTSGIHLFRGLPEICDFFTDGEHTPLPEPYQKTAQLGLPMCLYALPRALRSGQWGPWWTDFKNARDTVWDRSDPLPTLGQFASVAALLLRAIRLRTDPLSASTHDIEWNGES